MPPKRGQDKAKQPKAKAAPAGDTPKESKVESEPKTKDVGDSKSKKRKIPSASDEPQKSSRRSGRSAPKSQPSQEQLLNFMLSKYAEELCRPEDEAEDIKTRGPGIKTYSSSVMSPFEELLCAVILSRPISHRLGLRSIRTVLNDPYNFTTPKAIQAAGQEKCHQALFDARTQHKAKTAEQISTIADVVLEKFTGKGDADGTKMQRLLDDCGGDVDKALDTLKTSIKGLGGTGMNIFLRRVQWLWENGYPYIDDKTSLSLRKLGLPEEAEELRKAMEQQWSKLKTKDLAGDDEAAMKRRAFVIILERAVGADLEGKVDNLVAAAAAAIVDIAVQSQLVSAQKPQLVNDFARNDLLCPASPNSQIKQLATICHTSSSNTTMVVRYEAHGKRDEQTLPYRIFIGRVVHSKTLDRLEILPRGALGVRPDGSIAFLRSCHSFEDDTYKTEQGFHNAETIHLEPSQFLMPGMIDTHLHAPQWPNLALGMEGQLKEWVEDWTNPIEASYSDNDKARRVYSDVVKTTLRLGSTTVAYNSSKHPEATNILAKTCYDAGQRAIVGKMCVVLNSTAGNWETSNEESLATSEQSIKYIQELDPQGRLVHPCIMPRGGPYCDAELMQGLGDQRKKYDAHVQLHMCEAKSDIDRMRQVHGDQWTSYSAMYHHHGLMTPKSIIAHCVHLAPEDYQNLKETESGVAHNPNSNTCLRDGECPVRELLDHGIKVGLGTDCSAGYMPSILDAIRQASNVSRHRAIHTGDERDILSFSELMYLATMGGASVVGLKDRIGNFEEGKRFDALLVDVKGVISADSSLWGGEEDQTEAMVKKFVFLGDDRNIRKVFVDGDLVAGEG